MLKLSSSYSIHRQRFFHSLSILFTVVFREVGMGRMRVRVKTRMGMVLRVTGRGHISQWAPYYYATHLRQHVHANLDLLNSTYTMCQPAISQCLIDWVKWVTGEVLEKLSQCKNVLWRWGRMVECCKIIPATDCIGKPHFKINRKQFSNANPYRCGCLQSTQQSPSS